MPKKRYLFIGYNYYPEFTGIAKYTAEMCDYLANVKKYDVSIITGNPYYPMWKLYEGYQNKFKQEFHNGVHVSRIPIYIPQQPTGRKRMIQDFSFLLLSMISVSKKLILDKKYDYLVIIAPSFLLGFVGMYYKLFSKKTKIIYHIQDLQIDAAKDLRLISNQKLLKVLFFLEKKILARVDFISTISAGMKVKISAKVKAKKDCLLFPNWIDDSAIFSTNGFEPQKNGLASFQNKKVMLYSGSIGEKQGLEILIEVADKLKTFPEILFVICGEGPYRVVLEARCKDKNLENIIFFNLAPAKDFNVLLNRADIHLIIQKNIDGDLFFPSKLNNIMAVGGCLIATVNETGSLYHLINKYTLGKIVPPSSPDELYKAILYLLASEDTCNGYKKNALTYAKNHLLKEHIIERFLLSINSTPSNRLVN
ncbi:WcaI family glycosyltransferase [Parasediminibacterium sp. JCM 36343]|uniref:WcaI family glycosyltransferase n=1 Tax=Parasediminibacterium sp. JCM 36343 TaxID=3374279 RepID=UPI00397CB4D7